MIRDILYGIYAATVVALFSCIHTWPEYGFAAVDAFMCGAARAADAVDAIAVALGAQTHARRQVARGGVSGGK